MISCEVRSFHYKLECDLLTYLPVEQIDAETLRSVSRQDVLNLFMERIHPSSKIRSKLSLHLRSQTASGSKFTVAASKVLLVELKAKGVAVQEEDYHKLSAAEPPLSAVKAFWSNHFKTLSDLSKEDADSLLKAMDRIAKENPAETVAGEDEGKLGEDVVHVHDMAVFKAGLVMSKAATPVVEYNDVEARL